MTTTLRITRPRRRPSLAAVTPVAVLLAALVTGTTTADQVSAVAPIRRPAAMPRLLSSDSAVVVVERQGTTTVYERDGQPSWPTEDADAEMAWPTQGEATSEFGERWGRMHNGIDIAADTGTPIVAAKDGRVVFCGWMGGYGHTIDIDHGSGVITRYAHQSTTVASEGEQVDQGQLIGKVGMTGSATGPHLHFEVRVDDEERDPRRTLAAVG